MFDDIIRPSIRVGSRKPYVVPLSIGAHVLVIGAGILGAVMTPGILPVPVAALTAVFARDIVLPPPPPAAPRSGNAPRQASAHADAAPVEAPSAIAPESTVDPAAPPALLGTVEGPGNVAEALGQGIVPQPVAPSVPIILRVGGNIRPPLKTKNVAPVYPPLALNAHIEGVVSLETTIDVNGRVIEAKVLRSIPILDGAALEAVRQWEFTPTQLNGTAVPVIMTVTVNFSLR